MNALNQIILEGNIVRQPEKKQMPSGAAVCTLSIAVNRKYKTQTGEQAQEVSYFDVDSYGNLAEVCAKWCPKGRGIRIVGRLKQNRWQDSDGKSHSKVKIIAEHIEFKPFLKRIENVSDSQQEKTLSKEEKLAMIAEVAQAAQSEQENAEEIAF